jgi:peptide/nickel transport system permease protein
MANRIKLRVQSVLAVTLVLAFVLTAILAEVIAPTTGELVDGVQLAGKARDQIPHPPSPDALLGTTPGQMDIFYALIHGSRDALVFGLTTALLTALIGLFVGTIGSMSGGWVNQLSMRFTDGVLCFPVIAGIAFFQEIINLTKITLNPDARLFLGQDISPVFITPALTAYVKSILNQPNDPSILYKLDPVMLALIILSWVPYARMMNILILNTKKKEYVAAARAAGANGWRIYFRHILPNTAAPLIVLISKDIGQMVVWQTTFAFVGFLSISAWTSPLIVSRSWILGMNGNPLEFWWVYLPITLAIILFAFAWNLLGDEINHWLNPNK